MLPGLSVGLSKIKETNKETFAGNMRAKIIPKPFNIDNIVRVNQKGEAALLEMVSPKEAVSSARNDQRVALLNVRSALEFSRAHSKDSV
ncbi:MAG: hypothetical protein HQL30_02440 [Candidatus Omnitrophica bacterium]|nr:hypothetical protein [Candidatus Omnitrophota bacterium]